MKGVYLFTTSAAMALALAACGQKTSAVAPGAQASSSATSSGAASPSAVDQRDAPAPLFDGKPMWAANRKHSAQENAQFQFAKNGGDFGATSETDYLTKVHAFIEQPPRDVQSLDRSNGDRLIYDPKGNVFAVVSRNGAPRTMFKPRDGAAYWTQQKEREAKRAKGPSDGAGDQS